MDKALHIFFERVLSVIFLKSVRYLFLSFPFIRCVPKVDVKLFVHRNSLAQCYMNDNSIRCSDYSGVRVRLCNQLIINSHAPKDNLDNELWYPYVSGLHGVEWAKHQLQFESLLINLKLYQGEKSTCMTSCCIRYLKWFINQMVEPCFFGTPASCYHHCWRTKKKGLRACCIEL